MPDTQSLLSVGIDVGTTTTQVVFSRLQLANVARTGLIPRVSITAREILYQSPIMLTPLQDEQTIDAEKLHAMVRQEYAAAQVDPGQVETGAVIITGETAKKKNADAILQALSGLAGEFIVSIAGPNVESLISGRGSGAAQYSQAHYATVTNVDIVEEQVFVRYLRAWARAVEGREARPVDDQAPRMWPRHEDREAEMQFESVLRQYPLTWFYS